MFGTMSRDVEVLDKHAKGRRIEFTPRLTLRAEFDPKYGYPAGYRRIQWGSPSGSEVAGDEVRNQAEKVARTRKLTRRASFPAASCNQRGARRGRCSGTFPRADRIAGPSR